ncbi:cytochrome b562 [Hydromonas duriensis]|uniref:Soluble cytochrome b562 n=1 Tax=Hydromonas duriensis TaxID=1527608 RepID=A0A4R6Y7S6_9BURK|nr:cytochrome b562 [Hydromonas duriensis]TDR31397.1 soluble cytochrome b562 [Hydromonas duriensis]
MTAWFLQYIKNGFFIASLAVFSTIAVVPAAQADEIELAMKSMKSAYRGAMSSTTIEEFAQYAQKLQSSADAARKHYYDDSPVIYREGMERLQKNIADVNQAVRSSDLVSAKAALERMDEARRHYHYVLDEND